MEFGCTEKKLNLKFHVIWDYFFGRKLLRRKLDSKKLILILNDLSIMKKFIHLHCTEVATEISLISNITAQLDSEKQMPFY